ncbi:MAG: hypothetical protein GKR89_04190 [Candidatus Latescibacteria bacterium]|nr:hypothetical protein [Candidatus Latescibacterota bacterium]
MFSKIVRRTHMYLALFLMPWIVMYALSTMAMNHRHFFEEYYGDKEAPLHIERTLVYDGIFPEGASPRQMARQLLLDLELDGTHYVRGGRNGQPLTVWRESLTWIRKITYEPDGQYLKVERREWRTPQMLEEMHRRSGFEHDYTAADLWGVVVDLVIVALVLWVLSGLWMWWELKVTRRWGGICFVGATLLFALFLATI